MLVEQQVNASWEIFLVLPDGTQEQADAVGTFDSFDTATGAATMLARLLSGDDRSPDVLMFVHCGRRKRDAKALLKIARDFYRRGIDPGRVAVEVERYGTVCHCLPTNDEDTLLVEESPQVRKDDVSVRADRHW
jgi:hypothetical protein